MTSETPPMAKKSRDDDMTSTTEGLKEAVARRVYSAMVGAAGYARGTRPIPKWVIGGNSIVQDDARAVAADILSLISSSPLDAEGWRPIETAPRDGTEILLFWPEYRRSEATMSIWGGVDFDASAWRSPSHWLPLPAAPATVLCGGGRNSSSVADSALSLLGDSTETEGH